MAEIKDDGGPAFGHAAENGHCCGATLRDYFAGQVIGGMFADGSSCAAVLEQSAKNELRPTEIAARIAYSVADAMIAERKK